MDDRVPRIFLGLTEVAGYYARLAEGLHALGVPATVVDLSEHPFQYSTGQPTRLARWTAWAFRRRRAALSRGASGRAWLLLEVPLRAALLTWAITRFDVFVFGFGVTFLGRPAIELPLLRALGKRIIVICHGSDSRPPYLDGSVMAADRGRSVDDCVRLTRATRRRVALMDRWAHVVVDNPLSSHFHDRPCVQWLALGIPCPEGEPPSAPLTTAGEPVRILHSPSHPEAKGTMHIRAAVERLRESGRRIQYVEISGRPHAEVLAELARCDLVVDQLYSDTPMAGFAAEAAAFGKVAVVGSYGSAAMNESIPAALVPPVVVCHPDDLETVLAGLVDDADARVAHGRAAAAFVRTRWAAREVAARLLELVAGRIPDSWLFDPFQTRYVGGCCLPAERVRALVSEIVSREGSGALQLADKPELEAALQAFAVPARPVEEPCSVAC